MCGGYGYRGTENNARIIMVLVLTIVVTLAATPVLAASKSDDSINWYIMAMQLAGGLAIFLYGMEKMSDALKIVAGDRLRDILGKLTTNRFMGLITGAGVTAVVQSSSITTVMLVGFVSAGLMTSVQSIGVIFGANIGTTITAQIIAFKVTKFSLLLVAVGFVMDFAGKRETVKHYGSLIMGLGLIFFGLAIMSSGMKPLRSYEPFILLMQDVSSPAIGIAVALVFTAAVQSSSATTGVVIALATQGLISLEGGIALILGANIGTCVTAGLAAIGKDREAVRVAVAHVTFNIVGVFIIVWFIPYLAELVRAISPAAETLTGADKLAAETPRQIANAHTIFNVGFSLLFLPFVGAMAKFCEIVVPTRVLTPEEVATAKFKPKYLDELLIRTPAMALSMARREIIRMSQVVDEMLSAIPETVLVGNVTKMKEVRDLDDHHEDERGARPGRPSRRSLRRHQPLPGKGGA
jgi:phosphate:Na+ symporter